MTTKKHNKHPPLERPNIGMYNRCEWAIYGTTCQQITMLVDQITDRLSPGRKTVYVDADHSEGELSTELQVGKKRWSSDGARSWSTYDDKLLAWPADLALINGNHYPATRQIVVIDPKKKNSLQRRVDQLTAIDIVLTEEEADIYPFVREKMNEDTLLLKKADLQGVADYLRAATAPPPVKALVLAGGKSLRMSEDKATIAYHDGMPHEQYVASLCQQIGIETYLSKGIAYKETTAYGLPVITDRYVDMGPMGAILTAFMREPDTAWLVLACDLPLLDADTISTLVEARRSTCYGTAYQVAGEPFPEPLLAIYEPAIYQRMLQFLSLGYACPRKVLINSDIHLVPLTDNHKAYNANTPEEKEEALQKLTKK